MSLVLAGNDGRIKGRCRGDGLGVVLLVYVVAEKLLDTLFSGNAARLLQLQAVLEQPGDAMGFLTGLLYQGLLGLLSAALERFGTDGEFSDLLSEIVAGVGQVRHESYTHDVFEREADAVAAQVVHQQPDAARTSDNSGAAGSPLERALARFAPRPATSAAATVIQRKGTHFWQYLTSKVPDLDPRQKSDGDLLISAWLLDKNIYELQSLLSHDATPDLENMTELNNVGLTLADVEAYLNRCGAPTEINDRQRQHQFLAQFVANVGGGVDPDQHRAVGAASG